MVKHGKLIFEYNKITEYIYIGTNQCCQIHFNQKLLKKGIKADISLEKEKIDAPFGVDYYLWLPVKDHTAPSLKQYISDFRSRYHARVNVTLNAISASGHGDLPMNQTEQKTWSVHRGRVMSGFGFGFNRGVRRLFPRKKRS